MLHRFHSSRILFTFLFFVHILFAQTSPDSLITITAVGDVMLGSTFPRGSLLSPNDSLMLREVTPILAAADIAIGNLEGPLIDGGTSTKCGPKSTNCYAFRMPTRYASLLKNAGFDLLSIANNHAMDFGLEGRRSTMQALESVGIKFSGAVGDIASVNVKRSNVAFIAFSYDDDSYNLNKLAESKRVIEALARKHDIVIVSFHGGAEGASKQHVPHGHEYFLGEDRGDLRMFTHAAVDAGADLILGHGPHVVRGMEMYKDRLIAYSLGNFATYGRFTLTGPNGIALMIEVHLDSEGKFHSGLIHPIQQDNLGPHLDSSKTVIPVLRQLSFEDFGTNGIDVDQEGRLIRRE